RTLLLPTPPSSITTRVSRLGSFLLVGTRRRAPFSRTSASIWRIRFESSDRPRMPGRCTPSSPCSRGPSGLLVQARREAALLDGLPAGGALLAHDGAGGADRAESALRPWDAAEDGGAGADVHRDVCLLMSAEPYPSWGEKLNRALQAWRDSAARQARRPMFADDRPCDDCRRDPYVVIAQLEDESTAYRWPHWMQHTLREHLIDVRGELSEALALRAYAGA